MKNSGSGAVLCAIRKHSTRASRRALEIEKRLKIIRERSILLMADDISPKSDLKFQGPIYGQNGVKIWSKFSNLKINFTVTPSSHATTRENNSHRGL